MVDLLLMVEKNRIKYNVTECDAYRIPRQQAKIVREKDTSCIAQVIRMFDRIRKYSTERIGWFH